MEKIKLRDARNYCIIGYVELQCSHKTEGWHNVAFFKKVDLKQPGQYAVILI